ncbi:glycoside hydrolase family 16 protein [Nocardioides pelophilus]|uniref:glycoside hydrolase family 16 protein n=1 Tax=Nocardioides pelophilus TaxID=2172019 RepID=UPI0016042E2E|nr:glycoside hydrolase family 16 protein [Nocardioides pelophilus]
MLGPAQRVRRVLAGAALLGAAGIAPLQAAAPPGDAAAVAIEYDACGPVLTKANGTPWTCTFVDRFDASTLDTDKWVVQETAVTGFRTGRTCYSAAPRNVSVRDGHLFLTAHEGGWFRCRNPLRSFSTRYTGGMIGTRGKFSQTYGRFEIRAKYPTARSAGVHGGFWMYPKAHTYGPWPASGELDVAEWWSHRPNLVLPSLHYEGRDPEVDSGWDCTVDDVSTFHTYAVEWRPAGMRFFIDGEPCFERSWTPDWPLVAPQPFDHPFSMILNMGADRSVSWKTPFPQSLVVAHAKAWR